jgi:hypothetical protein
MAFRTKYHELPHAQRLARYRSANSSSREPAKPNPSSPARYELVHRALFIGKSADQPECEEAAPKKKNMPATLFNAEYQMSEYQMAQLPPVVIRHSRFNI